jgi:hypothetical protein
VVRLLEKAKEEKAVADPEGLGRLTQIISKINALFCALRDAEQMSAGGHAENLNGAGM